ncbi:MULTISPECIES: hypothetical protein [Enterobacteriaceae]|uniref:hypothetical protein n=1 Tax=Enterobacteriaceae TaxID=543 RepID=UPI000DF49810|nr:MULTISPECIES: hypothetical protein [Enterobacteriaceae]ELY4804904.1 hypothetical protein [Cronobacter malonaticus]QFH69561.1 hypothetical protein FR762_07340 [Enterobacter sp. E76]AXF63321.1 hypothetical protein DVA44_03800 [Leclercia sp. W17]ELT0891259.1 hypothetical protein [Citrobacter freundii]MBG2618577.1 hypothetical protein [Klebsiella michiganensis]
MNLLNLIIDRPKHFGKDHSCAVDIELDSLPAMVTRAMTRHIPDLIYRNQLSHYQADFIMRELIRILDGQPVKATVTDHSQRKTQVYHF